MKPHIIFLMIAVSITNLHAQVGFDNPNPHPRSILDLTATEKGLLIPRLTTVQRDALTLVLNPAAESLLVYDTNLQGFYFFRAGTWYSLNEWVKTAGSNDVSLTGNATIVGTVSATSVSSSSITNSGSLSTASVTSAGNVSAGSLNVSGFSTNALVPTGAIIMWSGTTPPSGWALCDGGGSPARPDLRGKFIVGYNSSDVDYDAMGKNGGETRHILSASELPSHPHNFTFYSVKAAVNPAGDAVIGLGIGTSGTGIFTSRTDLISATGTTGLSHENRPPFYTLAYIIKL
jgi:microcystin-dependent protein